MEPREADIVISGKQLSFGQSMTVRVAINHMLMDLSDGDFMLRLGAVGPLYKQRLLEIQEMIFLTAR